jgi:hypothetical protein
MCFLLVTVVVVNNNNIAVASPHSLFSAKIFFEEKTFRFISITHHIQRVEWQGS